jgi:very-short-patch-repair endonuclease
VREESKATPLNPPLSGGRLKGSPLIRGAGRGLSLSSDKDMDMASFTFLPYNKNLTERARENRKNPTKAESEIWHKVLRMRQFAEYKFLRQKPIDNYIVDFYCSELQLVIEIDGDSHAEAVEYDAVRTNILESLDLTVVRYTNEDVLRNIEGVYDDLCQRLEKLAPLDRGEQKAPSPVKGRAGEGFE